MSKSIDFSQPLSAEDAAYVADRPWLVTDAELAGFTVSYADEDAEDAEDAEDEEDEEVDYNDLTVDELKAEIAARNEERDEDDQIVASGTKKQDFIDALEADDEDQAE